MVDGEEKDKKLPKGILKNKGTNKEPNRNVRVNFSPINEIQQQEYEEGTPEELAKEEVAEKVIIIDSKPDENGVIRRTKSFSKIILAPENQDLSQEERLKIQKDNLIESIQNYLNKDMDEIIHRGLVPEIIEKISNLEKISSPDEFKNYVDEFKKIENSENKLKAILAEDFPLFEAVFGKDGCKEFCNNQYEFLAKSLERQLGQLLYDDQLPGLEKEIESAVKYASYLGKNKEFLYSLNQADIYHQLAIKEIINQLTDQNLSDEGQIKLKEDISTKVNKMDKTDIKESFLKTLIDSDKHQALPKLLTKTKDNPSEDLLTIEFASVIAKEIIQASEQGPKELKKAMQKYVTNKEYKADGRTFKGKGFDVDIVLSVIKDLKEELSPKAKKTFARFTSKKPELKKFAKDICRLTATKRVKAPYIRKKLNEAGNLVNSNIKAAGRNFSNFVKSKISRENQNSSRQK